MVSKAISGVKRPVLPDRERERTSRRATRTKMEERKTEGGRRNG